jgi:rSAM/selenodomain-associated transferase 1
MQSGDQQATVPNREQHVDDNGMALGATRPPRTLMVFARVPRPGAVKTRLIPALGAGGAARVYRLLLRRTLIAAARVPEVKRELWCTAEPDMAPCTTLARRLGMRLRRQGEGDLGARMAAAFEQALGYEPAGPAVLIGSDCPGYQPGYLAQAFALLEDRKRPLDAVIGPALDGGYVLIGLRRPAPSLFEHIPWGTGEVLGRTCEALTAAGLRWAELPALGDIDRPEDLADHPDLLAAAQAHNSTE